MSAIPFAHSANCTGSRTRERSMRPVGASPMVKGQVKEFKTAIGVYLHILIPLPTGMNAAAEC